MWQREAVFNRAAGAGRQGSEKGFHLAGEVAAGSGAGVQGSKCPYDEAKHRGARNKDCENAQSSTAHITRGSGRRTHGRQGTCRGMVLGPVAAGILKNTNLRRFLIRACRVNVAAGSWPQICFHCFAVWLKVAAGSLGAKGEQRRDLLALVCRGPVDVKGCRSRPGTGECRSLLILFG